VHRDTTLNGVDLYVSVQEPILASVAAQVQKLVDEVRRGCRAARSPRMRGQVQTMQASFIGWASGPAVAIVYYR
jgi:hypothetical protein